MRNIRRYLPVPYCMTFYIDRGPLIGPISMASETIEFFSTTPMVDLVFNKTKITVEYIKYPNTIFRSVGANL